MSGVSAVVTLAVPKSLNWGASPSMASPSCAAVDRGPGANERLTNTSKSALTSAKIRRSLGGQGVNPLSNRLDGGILNGTRNPPVPNS